MGLGTRLKTGWRLSRDSIGVLRSSPSLAVFPAVGGVAGAAYLATLVGGGVLFGAVDLQSVDVDGLVGYALLFVAYFGTTFVASFTSAGLMYNAREVFRGREPTVREGFAAARRNVMPLFAWAVVSATVGTALRRIEDSGGGGTDLVAFLFGTAWGVMTYFAVPVVVFEDVSVTGMFGRAAETFRETWGEAVGVEFGLTYVIGLVTLGAVAVPVALFYGLKGVPLSVAGVGVDLLVAVVVGGPVVLSALVFGRSVEAVAKAALYVYATEGDRPEGFEDVDFSTPID